MLKLQLQILALMVPSFCLLYTYALPSIQVFPERKEAFGSPDLYLDIKYVGFPSRGDSNGSMESVEFDGVLATDLSQNEIKGKRFKVNGDIWYTFYLEDKKFLGWLTSSKKGCEPQLNYQLQKGDKIIKSGVMKAGFCT